MRVKLNLFDKDSSDSASRTVEVESIAALQQEHDKFVSEVRFSRCYPDHEFLEGTISENDAFDQWNDEL